MDTNAVVTRLTMVASPFQKGIGQAIQSLSKFSGALKIAAGATALVAVGIGKAVSEAVRFETQTAELAKVLGRDIAQPLAMSISELSTRMPVASERLLDVAAAAGRLGIRGAKNIRDFVETMGMIDVATDLTAEEAAESFARIAAVTQTPVSEVRRLADVFNRLSNTANTTFSELVRSVGEIAPIFNVMDIPVEDMVAFAAASNEVNVSVARGARRLRSFAQQIRETSREEGIANALNLTTEAFRRFLEEDPVAMLVKIASAMNAGGDSAKVLAEEFDQAGSLGITALGQNLQALQTHLQNAREEMRVGGSLMAEFGEFANTASSQMIVLRNQIDDFQRQIGRDFLPLLKQMLKGLSAFVRDLSLITRHFNPLESLLSDQQIEELEERLERVVGNFRFGPAQRKAVTETKRFIDRIAAALAAVDEGAGRSQLPRFFEAITAAIESGQFDDRAEEFEDFVVNLARSLKLGVEAIEEIKETFEEPVTPSGGLGEATDDAARRLSVLKNVARSLGIELKDLSDKDVEAAQAIVEHRLEVEQGEFALNSFRRALDGVTPAVNFWITTQEMAAQGAEEHKEKLEEAAQAFERHMQAAMLERIELTRGVEARRRQELALEGIIGAKAEEILLEERLVRRLKERRDAQEELRREQEHAAAERERELERIQNRLDRLNLVTFESRLRLLEDLAGDLSDTFIDTFASIAQGADNAGEAIVRMITDVARALIANRLTAFFTQLGLGLLSAGASSVATGVPAGATDARIPVDFAASGGPVKGNVPLIVGEEGPELFVPSMAGNIIPNDKLGRGGNNTIVIEQHYTIKALDGADVRRVLQGEADFLAAQTANRVARSDLLARKMRGGT